MSAPITIIPPSLRIIRVAAERLDARLDGMPVPDLDDHLVLVPGMQDAASLRAALLDTHPAVIGPRCVTLTTLAAPGADARRARRQSARLFLYGLLRRHRALYGEGDPWQLAEAVLHLFGEFEREGVDPGTDADVLGRRLADGYGSPAATAALGREAQLVTTLWQAWQDASPRALGVEATAIDALARVRGSTSMRLLVAGFDRLPAPLAAELDAWLEDGRAEILWAGDAKTLPAHWSTRAGTAPGDTGDVRGRLADTAFGVPGAPPLVERVRELGALPAPDSGGFAVWAAPDPEREAQAAALQVRRWWLSGCRRIAVVTDDRRLARRIHALLARAGIAPADPGGWALSTTSAAAALERWMETVERDFHASPLLDLFKSPFFPRDGALLEIVWRFEEGIVRRENVSRGIDAYRRALERRRARLPDDWDEASFTRLHALLGHVAHAARPLAGAGGVRTRRAADWIERFDRSLQRLGMRDTLAGDPAGDRVLDELGAMRQASAGSDADMDWKGFRTWLGRTLELETFHPGGDPSVTLLPMQAAAAGDWEAMIFCGCDAEHLPGPQPRTPFFNDGVRAELGLPTWEAERVSRLERFRRALMCAPRVVLTHAVESDGDPVTPSPWLELLSTAHRLAWGAPPGDGGLGALVTHVGAAANAGDRIGWPALPARPAPAAPGALPQRWSVAAHQQLIDCPYRFFAAQCLGLQAPDEIREYLAAMEFGNLVHRCLHAFLVGIEPLPGPYEGALEAARRDEARALLERIGERVFADALDASYAHRGWYRSWQAAIPALVDWEIARAEAGWRPEKAETRIERRVGPVMLHGRCDRIDVRGGAHAVIDYKTGTPPPAARIGDGENVQLSSYGLMLDDVTELRFVHVSDPGAGETLNAPGIQDSVAPLLEAVQRRLEGCADALSAGAPMPAWGDTATCRICQYSGVCRRDAWEHLHA